MNGADDVRGELQAVCECIAMLNAAILRINVSLDLDTALGEVVESARGVRRGVVIATVDEAGAPLGFVFSGFPGNGRNSSPRSGSDTLAFRDRSGWRLAAARPAAVGLLNMGGGTTTLVLLFLWLRIKTPTFAVLGSGIGVLLSIALPRHIGSATLATGEPRAGTRKPRLVLTRRCSAASLPENELDRPRR